MSLLVRKVVSAAAMIGLAAILGTVVYTIVAPQSGTEKPTAFNNPDKRIVATSEKTIAKDGAAMVKFHGRLELKTSALVDAFISRAIEDNSLLENSVPKRQPGKSVWAKLDSAQLFVEADRLGGQVAVGAVSTKQIVEIVNQNSTKNRIELAKDFSVFNNITGSLPGKEILAAIKDKQPDSMTIPRPPKPTLTSNDKTIKISAKQTNIDNQVNLTIVVLVANNGS